MINEACHNWQGGAERGGIGDFLIQVSELRWSFFPYSARQPVSQDRESHPTALNASVCGEKNGKVFIQELENNYQRFLSKRYHHAWIPKKNANIQKRVGLRVNFLPHFLSVVVKMLSTSFVLSKSYG